MNRHFENLLLMKMQIVWFALFCVGAICTALLSSLSGTEWNTTDSQTKFMIIVGVLGNVTNTVMALFSTAMKRVADGEQPFVAADSTTSKKVVTSSVQVTETKTPPASP